MGGTVSGGKAASITNRAKYGENFYKEIGSLGGKKGRTGGFYANRELARTAGRKGGLASNRTGIKNKPKPVKLTWAGRARASLIHLSNRSAS